MPEIDAILTEFDEHRRRFEVFCLSLTEEELARPVPGSSWLVRDFIAHLATIDGPVAEMLRLARAGEDPGLRTADSTPFDVDDWNERRVQERRGWPIDQLLDEAGRERAALKRELLAFSRDELARTVRFPGDSKRPPTDLPLVAYLRGLCMHDPIHVADIIKALPARAAGVKDWIGDPVVSWYQRTMNSSL